MKFLSKILYTALALLALNSCKDLNPIPRFKQSDSFVSFVNPIMSVKEDQAKLEIPVLLSTITPFNTEVKFKVVSGDDKDAAVQGVNYTFAASDDMVKFTNNKRLVYIDLNINKVPGYTGDKTFSIQLVSATGAKIGAESLCTVTILDADHPLASLFGTYTATANVSLSKANISGAQTWSVVIEKNEKSLTSVKVRNLTPILYKILGKQDNSFVANVIKKGDKIVGLSLPVGQECASKFRDKNTITLGTVADGAKDPSFDQGNITATVDGSKIVFNNPIALDFGGDLSVVEVVDSGITLIKK